jgi:hypothetical protein
MSLATVLEEIQKIKPYADEDPYQGPPETMNGRVGRHNHAMERLNTLKLDYREALLRSAVFIVVTGEKREAFTQVATSQFGCLEANPYAFYENLAERLLPAFMQKRESVPNLFDILGRHIDDVMRNLGVLEHNQLIFRQEYQVTVNTKQDLTDLIRTAVNAQIGAEITGIRTVHDMVDKGIKDGLGANTVPIILSTGDAKFALDLNNTLNRLKTKGRFLVVSGKGTADLKNATGVLNVKNPSQEEVEKVLKTISESTKK